MKEYLIGTVKLPIQDLDSLTDDFEVAQDFFEMIAWDLAWRLCHKYGKPIDPMIKMAATEMLEDAMTFDSDNTSTFIEIARSR